MSQTNEGTNQTEEPICDSITVASVSLSSSGAICAQFGERLVQLPGTNSPKYAAGLFALIEDLFQEFNS